MSAASDAGLLAAFARLYFHDPAVALLRATEARLVTGRDLAAPLLDLGSGNGSFLDLARPRGPAVALDWRLPRARAAARRRAYGHGVAAVSSLLPFAAASFATVLANSSLEHMADMDRVLVEIRRVLAPGGTLVMAVHLDNFACAAWFWPRLLAPVGLAQAYRQRRLKRLGIASLWSANEWRERLVACGFSLEETVVYMAPAADRVFERELVLARFGLWKLHVSALARILARVGVAGVRDVLGRWHARRLAPAYAAAVGAGGTALFVVARAPGSPASLSPASLR